MFEFRVSVDIDKANKVVKVEMDCRNRSYSKKVSVDIEVDDFGMVYGVVDGKIREVV